MLSYVLNCNVQNVDTVYLRLKIRNNLWSDHVFKYELNLYTWCNHKLFLIFTMNAMQLSFKENIEDYLQISGKKQDQSVYFINEQQNL